jgi:hypothetical protein
MSTTTTPAAEIGTILHLPLTQIRDTGLNVRHDPAAFEDLSDLDTLKERQESAIRVYPSTRVPGDFDLDDGHRRFAAAKRLGLDTLRAEVVAPPATEAERIARMLVSGTSGRPLVAVDIAEGLQGMLSDGWDLPAVEKRLGRRKGPASAHNQPGPVEQLQDTFEAAFEIAEARAALASDTGALHDLNKALEGVVDAEDALAAVDEARASYVLELLEAAEVPESGGYYDLQHRDMDTVATSTYLDMPRDEALALFKERAAEGWVVSRHHLPDYVFWYGPRPEADDLVAEPEDVAPSAEELEQIAAEEAATIALAAGNDARDVFLTERFARAEPVAGLVLHRLAVELVADQAVKICRYNQSPTGRALLGLTDVPVEPEQEFRAAAVVAARKHKVSWLVSWMSFVANEREELFARLKMTQDDWGRNRATAYLEYLTGAFGYEVTDNERQALAYPAPWPPVTATCTSCSQEVVATADWAGVCESCSEPSV